MTQSLMPDAIKTILCPMIGGERDVVKGSVGDFFSAAACQLPIF